jgi:site-specific recombinase XerD
MLPSKSVNIPKKVSPYVGKEWISEAGPSVREVDPDASKTASSRDFVFGTDSQTIRRRMRKNFDWSKNHIAGKTANKDLKEIKLHTFRHFYATKLYLQTRDIRYVQKKLGHRSITSTTIYETQSLAWM